MAAITTFALGAVAGGVVKWVYDSGRLDGVKRAAQRLPFVGGDDEGDVTDAPVDEAKATKSAAKEGIA